MAATQKGQFMTGTIWNKFGIDFAVALVRRQVDGSQKPLSFVAAVMGRRQWKC